MAELLRRGHDVRTTVRDLAREPAVRATVERAGVDAGDHLTVVAADLSDDTGWAEAVTGCSHVLHVASPFPPEQPKDPDELIVPAREGALRAAGARVRNDIVHGRGGAQVLLDDPSGNPIELFQPSGS